MARAESRLKRTLGRKDCSAAGFPNRMGESISMSPAILARADAPSATTGAGVEVSRPVSRPKGSVFKLIGEVLRHGGPGYLQFAITNICNAKCDFCGFAVDRFDPKKRRSVTLGEARDVIDICVKNHIGYLLFVGGGPLVHKNLRAMTRGAAGGGVNPLSSLASSYLSFSDSSLVSYKTEELIQVFEKIKRMKQRSGFPVVNPAESLTEMQRHLRREPEKFGCLGGHKYFYLDSNLNLYRCHFWETPMCNIYEFDQSKQIRDGCQRCMIDCYRDPSVLQFVAINASDAWHNLRRGKLIAAAKNVFDSRNLTSLKAVWEERKWITGG